MLDVFVSYTRAEKDKAKMLVDALMKEGFVVWWDADILSFEKFDKQVKVAIKRAACSIVLWSKKSVESSWVTSEAVYAKHNGRLIHVAIDPFESFELPLGFGYEQCYDLAGWNGSSNHTEF